MISSRNINAELSQLRVSLTRDIAASPTPPRILYHYTSAAGLRGILESKSIWLTDLRFMNDLSELQYAQSLIADRAANYLESHSPKNPIQESFGLHLQRRSSEPFLPGFAVYSASFCEAGNLLSQWRAYRGQGGGYALGFDSLQAFKSLGRDCLLRKAIYDVEVQRGLVDRAIHAFFTYLEDPPPGALLTETVNKAAGEFSNVVLPYYYSFKHPDFREEQEWRLVHFARTDPRMDRALAMPKFRDFDGNIIPYHVASLATAIEASKSDAEVYAFPFPEVVIGPTINSQLNESSIKTLLLSINPEFAPRIVSSAIPLRWL